MQPGSCRGATLADEVQDLGRRPPGWVVYVEADPNVAWQYAVDVMDIIRGEPAEVVLLTSDTVKTRSQYDSKKDIE